MVTTTYHIKHPLSHGGAAATWWATHYLVRCAISAAIILLLALSTPWNEENLDRALLSIGAICGLAVTQKFLAKFTGSQINFYTPGYLGRFTTNEHVKGSNAAVDQVAASLVTLVLLVVFYLANPHNETYSTLAVVFGWVYSVTNLVNLGKVAYALSSLGQLKDKENWWFFFSPLVGLIVAAPLYKSFPVFAGIPANTSLAATLLALVVPGYLAVWGFQRLLRP